MSTQKWIISVLVGGLILFIWNAVSWMALPFHSNAITNMPEGTLNTETLKSNLKEDGVYHYPGMPTDNSQESMNAIEEKLSQGGRVTMMVYKHGATSLMDSKLFIGGFIINLITAFLMILLISKLSSHQLSNILFVSVIYGLVVAVVSDIGLMNWYMFPLDYTMANVVDRVVSFLLLGMFLGYYTFKNFEKQA